MINNYLSDYSAFMTLEELEQAVNTAYEIFKELIEEGMLTDELMDSDYVMATLQHDYDGYLLDEYALESLLELLGIYADQDDVEVDEEEIQTKQYAMVRYGLNLVDGTKNRLQPKFPFDGIEEVAEFLGIHVEVMVSDFEGELVQIGVTDLADRETILETLSQQEDIEFETIIENVPETAEVVMVFTYRDMVSGMIVGAEIFALYELGDFSLED